MSYEKYQLISVKESSTGLTIDARQLYFQLKVSSKFADWIKNRIKEFGFEEGKDFFLNFRKSTGGRKQTNYELTIDMAKELAMVERSEIGKLTRRYFIEVEKEAKRISSNPLLLPKRVHAKEINGRKIYPFRKLAHALGYKTGGTLYYRRKKYPGHFVKLEKVFYCSEEMGNLMAMGMSIRKHRQTIKQMPPVLPEYFGTQKLEGGTV